MGISAPTNLASINDHTDSGAGFTTASVTFPAGSLGILLFHELYPNPGIDTTAVTVVDSASNAWSSAVQRGSSQGSNYTRLGILFFYYAAQTTVTVTFNSNASAWERKVWVGYITGTTATPLDVTASSFINGTALGAATTPNRTADNEIALVVYGSMGTTTKPTSWPTSGFTEFPAPEPLTDSTNIASIAAFEYQIYSGGNGSTATTGAVTGAANNGEGFCIATFIPAAGAPVNTVPPAVTGTDTVGSTLSCSTGTWTGDTSGGFAYQWQRDNSGGGVYSNIGGATAATYLLAAADDQCHVRCVVTATGTGGSTAANSNSTPIITYAIPSGGSVAITGSPKVGQVLTATTTGWSPAPTSYTITWQRADDAAFTINVVTVRGPTTQAGNSDPYTVQAADDQKYLRTQATATDDGGTSAAVNSAPTAQVTFPPPVNVVPPFISGTAVVGGLLTVTPGQWQ